MQTPECLTVPSGPARPRPVQIIAPPWPGPLQRVVMRTWVLRALPRRARLLAFVEGFILERPLAAAAGGEVLSPLTSDQRALARVDEDGAGTHLARGHA